jgi:hypothetical protein
VESTVNNLRKLYNTLVCEMFSQNTAPLNIPQIMREGGPHHRGPRAKRFLRATTEKNEIAVWHPWAWQLRAGNSGTSTI